jgi:hypothetical protein
MKSTIDAVVGFLMILAVGASLPVLYRTIKYHTLLKVYDQLQHQDSLEGFSRKLTRRKH